MYLQLVERSPKAGASHSQEDFPSFSSVEEKDVLHSRASLLHPQRDRASQLPSPRDSCREVNMCVQPGVQHTHRRSRQSLL